MAKDRQPRKIRIRREDIRKYRELYDAMDDVFGSLTLFDWIDILESSGAVKTCRSCGGSNLTFTGSDKSRVDQKIRVSCGDCGYKLRRTQGLTGRTAFEIAHLFFREDPHV